MACPVIICHTRPKPAYGRQGLGWDPQATTQFGRVHFGVFQLTRRLLFRFSQGAFRCFDLKGFILDILFYLFLVKMEFNPV